jgi:hypothetical protein
VPAERRSGRLEPGADGARCDRSAPRARLRAKLSGEATLHGSQGGQAERAPARATAP